MKSQSRHPDGAARRARSPASLPAVCFVSFLLAAATAAAQAPAQESGAAPGAGTAAAPATARLHARALTPPELERLEKITLEKGTSVPLPAALASALHMTARQIAPTVRQSSFIEDDNFRGGGTRHGFALFNDGSGFFLFRRDTQRGVSVFHIDRHFGLVAAAHEFPGQRYLEMTDQAALQELQGEVDAWGRVLSPRGPVSLPAKPARVLPGGNAAAPAAPPGAGKNPAPAP